MSNGLVDTLVKIGGGLLAHPVHFEATVNTVADAAATRQILVVPGGGPFADAVRVADRQVKLDATTAHWMAVLAMDQYAHLLVSRLRASELVTDLAGIAAVLGRGRLPVLAPSRWLRERDPLPHSWDVTSDSIAAWLAGMVGASRLVLVKPPGAPAGAVDPYFRRALPENMLPPDIVPADQSDVLRRALTV
jgi:5-(aminomethyl)-3-furanmethanol phosphate kinase